MTDTLAPQTTPELISPNAVTTEMIAGEGRAFIDGTALLDQEEVAQKFDLNFPATLRGVIETNPGGGDQAEKFFIFDRGVHPGFASLARTNNRANRMLQDEERYVVVTATGLERLKEAADTNRSVGHNGWKVFKAGESMDFGRSSETAQALGQTMSDEMSRSHFRLSFEHEGTIYAQELGSTNGSNITRPRDEYVNGSELDVPTTPKAKLVGTLIANNTLEVDTPHKPELKLDDATISFEGVINFHGKQAYLLESTDSSGTVRKMFVYRSNSEGGLRVSQGLEKDNNERVMKGAELSPWTQYTQDTQLHPQFKAFIHEVAAQVDARSTMVPEGTAGLMYEGLDADARLRDFENQIQIQGMGNDKISGLLMKLKAGHNSMESVLQATGMPKGSEKRAWKKYEKLITELNDELEAAGVIPEFTAPVHVETDVHPLLGEVKREVYVHNYNGSEQEWHVSYDKNGRVWIDRIRLANSKPTVYGTDKDMIYSGILTSKPLEYVSQATGIPDALKNKSFGERYEDITPLLDKLAPIKKFRQQRGVLRQQ